MSRKRRTETLGVVFTEGKADGWAFGVADAFRMNLDIRYDTRVDAAASREKEQRLGRKLKANEKVLRSVWTQGVPAAYSFGRGHIFHDPPIAHVLGWDAALPLLHRSIVVLEAKADPGALVEIPADESADEGSIVVESGVDRTRDGTSGWVDIEVQYYQDGQLLEKEKTTRTQAALVEILRTGRDPLNPSFQACRCQPSTSTYSCLTCTPRTGQLPGNLSLFDDLEVAPSAP